MCVIKNSPAKIYLIQKDIKHDEVNHINKIDKKNNPSPKLTIKEEKDIKHDEVNHINKINTQGKPSLKLTAEEEKELEKVIELKIIEFQKENKQKFKAKKTKTSTYINNQEKVPDEVKTEIRKLIENERTYNKMINYLDNFSNINIPGISQASDVISGLIKVTKLQKEYKQQVPNKYQIKKTKYGYIQTNFGVSPVSILNILATKTPLATENIITLSNLPYLNLSLGMGMNFYSGINNSILYSIGLLTNISLDLFGTNEHIPTTITLLSKLGFYNRKLYKFSQMPYVSAGPTLVINYLPNEYNTSFMPGMTLGGGVYFRFKDYPVLLNIDGTVTTGIYYNQSIAINPFDNANLSFAPDDVRSLIGLFVLFNISIGIIFEI